MAAITPLLPLDGITLPLTAAGIDLMADFRAVLQLVKSTIDKREKGVETREVAAEADRLQKLIMEHLEARRPMYKSVEHVLGAVDRFKPEAETRLLSKSGNTPLQSNEDTCQSDEMNDLVRSVCAAEYAARNFDDAQIIADLQQQTGLNFSSAYSRLHRAVRRYVANSDQQEIVLLSKVIFQSDDVPEAVELKRRLAQSASPVARAETARFFSDLYHKHIALVPYFPEQIAAKGFEVFSTEFCSKEHQAEAMEFGGMSCACPCCLFPEGFEKPNSRKLQNTLRCVVDGKLIDLDKDKYFFSQGEGFVCAAHAAQKNARRIVLCWG